MSLALVIIIHHEGSMSVLNVIAIRPIVKGKLRPVNVVT